MNEKPEPSEEYMVRYCALIDDATETWEQLAQAINYVCKNIAVQLRRAMFSVYLSRWLPARVSIFLARHWPLALMPEIDLSFLDSVPDDPAD